MTGLSELLRDQFKWHWDHQLRPRLEGLTPYAIEYDADITALQVREDGTFEASGEDAAGEALRLTGTCQVFW